MCPISYLSSLAAESFFSLSPPSLLPLLTLSHRLSLCFPLFFLSSFHLITFLSLPIHLFLRPYFLCLLQTLTHIRSHAHTCWKQIREANTNCCQLVTVGSELEYKCSALSEYQKHHVSACIKKRAYTFRLWLTLCFCVCINQPFRWFITHNNLRNRGQVLQRITWRWLYESSSHS